jgi:hypothetical protein
VKWKRKKKITVDFLIKKEKKKVKIMNHGAKMRKSENLKREK